MSPKKRGQAGKKGLQEKYFYAESDSMTVVYFAKIVKLAIFTEGPPDNNEPAVRTAIFCFSPSSDHPYLFFFVQSSDRTP